MKYTQMDIILVLLYGLIGLCTTADLDRILHHYDTLHHRDIHHHHIGKRSLGNGGNINDRIISFRTLGRDFELHLSTNRHLFSRDFQAVAVGGSEDNVQQIELDKEEFYEGYISDDPSSHVQAHYEDKNLVVKIKTKEDIYVVEPAWRHLDTPTDDVTMISYRASDLKTDQEQHPGQHVSRSFCGYVREGVDHLNDTHPPVMDEPNTGYSFAESHDEQHEYRNRYKRQAVTKNICRVVLVADYHFTQEVGENNTLTTSKYLAGVLNRVNAIYRSTDFGNGYTNMGFEVARIMVYTSPSTTPEFNKEQNFWQTESLLKSFGQVDWMPASGGVDEEYCLAHLFTYLAFDGGVQGLGWVASSKTNEIGGVCSQVYNNLRYNTAWTSNKNSYGQRILSQEADLVTAHEFGHNWGSPHDPADCAPSGGDGGKYVMYQYSVSGYDPNNNDFSSCSSSSIGSVLQVKSDWCFVEEGAAICGNSQVEDGEECDAGENGRNGFDLCCDRNCKLFKGKVCSDANSACCSQCQFATSDVVCREGSSITCDATAKCTGSSPDCPGQVNRGNGESCLDRGTCQNGTCLKMCEFNGRTSCTCDEGSVDGGDDPLALSCQYCCIDPATSKCRPFTEPAESGPVNLPDGRSCYAGKCALGLCEASQSKSTARFWDIIKDFNTNAIVEWMKNNIVITVIVLSLILYLPICLIIYCVDRRNRKNDAKEREWLHKDNEDLVRDGETMEIRRSRPRQRGPSGSGGGTRRLYDRLDEDSEASASGVNFRP